MKLLKDLIADAMERLLRLRLRLRGIRHDTGGEFLIFQSVTNPNLL